MNKIAIIAALAAGGSLFAQTVSYGVGGQNLTSVTPGAVNGTFSASYAAGTLTVSSSGTYYTEIAGVVTTTPSLPSLTLEVAGPVTFSAAATVSGSSGFEDGFWGILATYSAQKNNSASFTIPSGLFTVTLKDGGTAIASGTFTVVPEPETYAATAALGLVGFGLWSRRSKKA